MKIIKRNAPFTDLRTLQKRRETKLLTSMSLERPAEPFLKLWTSSEPQTESLSTNGETHAQTSERHLKGSKPHLPQSGLFFMIQQK